MPRRQRPVERPDESPPAAGGERLQKVLAAAGLGSRRECEQLIEEGRVDVDGQPVKQLGIRVDAARQRIRVDGVVLSQPRLVYFAVHKPAGVVCTSRDPAGRTRVIDLIHTDFRLFTVGRLDRASEGLILVTNDGDLANRLTHPRYGVDKTYAVEVAGHLTVRDLHRLRAGIRLSDALVRVAALRIKRQRNRSTQLELVLNEGRNREIRRMLARVGHKVLRLKRLAVGPLRLGDLPVGSYRPLVPAEVKSLDQATRVPQKVAPPARTTPGSSRRSPAARRKAVAKGPPRKPSQPAARGRGPAAAGGRPRGAKAPRPAPQKPTARGRGMGSVLDYEPPAGEP